MATEIRYSRNRKGETEIERVERRLANRLVAIMDEPTEERRSSLAYQCQVYLSLVTPKVVRIRGSMPPALRKLPHQQDK